MTTLVEYRNFTISYRRPDGTPLPVVTGVDLDVRAGECLAIVGESGAGKSQLLLAPLRLTATPPILGGSVQTQGAELVGATEELLDRLRGARFGGTDRCVIIDLEDNYRSDRPTLGYQAFRELWVRGRRSAAKAPLPGSPENALCTGQEKP